MDLIFDNSDEIVAPAPPPEKDLQNEMTSISVVGGLHGLFRPIATDPDDATGVRAPKKAATEGGAEVEAAATAGRECDSARENTKMSASNMQA